MESSLPKGALLVYKEVLLAGETADSNANHATGLLSWIFNFALVGCFCTGRINGCRSLAGCQVM
jgi:hypothetical protein